MTDSPAKTVTHPILIVTGGPRDGDILLLNQTGLDRWLGSGAEADMRIEAANVDPRHARVVWDMTGLLLTDEGSSTGTYVNGERIGINQPLQDGDRVCLGPPGSRHSVKLLVRVPEAMPEPVLLELAPDFEPKAVEVFAPPPKPVPPPEMPPPAPPPPPTLPVSLAPPTALQLRFEEEKAISPPAPPPPEPQKPAAMPPLVLLEFPEADRGSGVAPSAEPPSAPRPLPLIPPPAGAKSIARRTGDLVSELPSIVDERGREPSSLPFPGEAAALPEPPAKPKKIKKPRLPGGPSRLPRPALIAGASAVLGVVGFLIYGFLTAPPPALSGVAPAKVEPGQTLTLSGASFGSTPGANTVRFGEQVAAVTSATASQLAVFVPDSLAGEKPEDVPVSVETRQGRSNALMVRVRRLPRVNSLEPQVAMPGAEILIKGQNLDATPLSVQIGGQAAEVRGSQPNEIRALVPDLPVAEGKGVPVAVQAGGETGRPVTLVLGRLPLLTGLQPASGRAGDRVTLKGYGFDPSPSGNLVEFGGEPALVLSASDRELAVVAPLPPTAGSAMPVQVVVKARGGTSSGATTFALSRSTGGQFVPHFFPAPVPEARERAAVATELGPVLLFGSKDDAASTAERASRVVLALNNAFGNAATVFELRESPQPGVGIAGSPSPLLRATSEDAAAYASARGSRPGARALAAYWTALLQDLHMLFVRRQRPTRVVEVSARGKVLLDIFSDAERRSGSGAGVPSSLVNPPSPALAKAFREMTTQLPEGGSAAGAAVAGQWLGSMNDGGVERSLRLMLRLEGGKLSGSASTKSGQISMDVPLQEVSYEKGTLSFSMSGGTALRRFRGSLQGSELTGSILGPSGSDPVGQFKLRYLE